MALPVMLRSIQQFSRYRKNAPEFLRNNRRRCAELVQRTWQTATKAKLLGLWNAEISPLYRDSMIQIVAAGSDIQVRLERELRALVGEEDASALLSSLGGPSGQLESMGPMAGLGLVLQGKMSRETYLENYGHRGVNEGECAWPRPAEDRLWLDRQLAEWQHSPVDVEELLTRQRAAYTAAWERFCQKYLRNVRLMQKRLGQAARVAQQRELVRSEGTRGMTVLRAFALRSGELLGVGEDIFFMTIDEILKYLAGAADTVTFQYIPQRKDTYQRYRALPPYPALICGRFDPNRRSDMYNGGQQTTPRTGSPEANAIHGFAGALGVVEGTVRRLDSVDESNQFQSVEVLVTIMTNIGWTPLFPRAAAVVTDLGAPLSHAAIVARELGIPAVVGCGDATMRLKTGARVRVDGGKGMVQIL